MSERPPLIVDVVLDPPFTVECLECGRELQVVISVRMESKLAERITSLKELCARAGGEMTVMSQQQWEQWSKEQWSNRMDQQIRDQQAQIERLEERCRQLEPYADRCSELIEIKIKLANDLEHVKALCARAADALENWQEPEEWEPLIAQLREAAK